MKLFTKIVLITSGIMAVIGTVCVIIACSMGLNLGTIRNMVYDGKFTFRIVDGFEIKIMDTDNNSISSEPVTITEEFKNLEIEFGAGALEICYGDVENVMVEPKSVVGFATEIDGATLHIEGGLGVNTSGSGSLKITLPQDYKLGKVDLEIGASSATVTGLTADTLTIEVGAGEATITQLNVSNLDAEVGVGELNVGLVGAQTDYSYSLECGIGEIKFGENSYGGLGNSHNVQQPGASRFIDVECGIGEVEILFEK